MFEFKLPDLGEGIAEGEILKWHVAEGGTIGEDEPLIDVETDKAAVTIPSPKGGKVVKLNGKEGETIEVGQVIAVIDDGAAADEAPTESATEPETAKDEGSEAARAEEEPAEQEPAPAQPSPPTSTPPKTSEDVEGRKVTAAPATRRFAREQGVDIRAVPGSGPAGRITKEDVERFVQGGGQAAAASSASSSAAGGALDATFGGDEGSGSGAALGSVSGIPYYELEATPDFSQFGPVEKEPVRSIRRKVAKKMTTSMIVAPHVALMEDVDVTDLEDFRRAERERRADHPGGKLSLLPFVAKALTVCLAEFPMFNASLDPQREEIVYKKYYGIGIAVDTPRGLMVPVVRDADKKSILDISASIVDVATRGRDGSIQPADFQGGSFTITNIGPLGGKGLIPTINYPEVAILGMGRAEDRVVVIDGEAVIRTILPLTLAFDHRIADGADAARFIAKLKTLLESPLSWLVEI